MTHRNGSADGPARVAIDASDERAALVGTVLTLPGPVSAELAAEPFDFVWIDLEHGALGRTEAQELLIGAQAAGAFALARIGAADIDGLAGPMLDAGADGIVAADVRAVEQAEHASALVRYPPHGVRGYGPRRSLARHRTHADATASRPSLWLQIESRGGVEAARPIAQTTGVDAIVVGIADLCSDLGVAIGLHHAELHDALSRVRDAAAAAGVAFGLAGPLHSAEELGDLLADARVLVHSTEARLFAGAVDAAAERLREASRHMTAASSCSSGANAGG